MGLPIDINKLKKAADTIQNASVQPISVYIFYDESANEQLRNFVIELFTPVSDRATILNIPIAEAERYVDLNPDMAVFIADSQPSVVQAYSKFKNRLIPACVITLVPHIVAQIAKTLHIKMPKSDLIYPAYRTYSKVSELEQNDETSFDALSEQDSSAVQYNNAEDAATLNCEQNQNVELGSSREESLELDTPNRKEKRIEEVDLDCFNLAMAESIRKKLVRWINVREHESRIVFAAKLEFLRESVTNKLILATSIQNAGMAALPFMKGADLPVLTLNQLKMVLQIAATYGYEVNKDRIIELLAVTGLAFVFRWLNKEVKKNTKAYNFIVNAIFGYFGTMIVGYAAAAYFSQGRSIQAFSDGLTGIYQSALNFAKGKVLNSGL